MTDYSAYIRRFAAEKSDLVKEMEQYAEENHVPIMDDTGLNTLIGLLQIQQPKRILEIGSAIGYSGIRLATAFSEAEIYTIERDTVRYEKALDFIGRSGMKARINIFHDDALTFDTAQLGGKPFDALFIDAAKGQYKKFFEKFSPLVDARGVIYCDNMFMHGMVLLEGTDIPKRNRTMIRNLQDFTQWIMENEEYQTALLPVGDGILTAVKRESKDKEGNSCEE